MTQRNKTKQVCSILAVICLLFILGFTWYWNRTHFDRQGNHSLLGKSLDGWLREMEKASEMPIGYFLKSALRQYRPDELRETLLRKINSGEDWSSYEGMLFFKEYYRDEYPNHDFTPQKMALLQPPDNLAADMSSLVLFGPEDQEAVAQLEEMAFKAETQKQCINIFHALTAIDTDESRAAIRRAADRNSAFLNALTPSATR